MRVPLRSGFDGYVATSQKIDLELSRFAKDQSHDLHQIGSELVPVAEAMTRFIVDGGKRFRPIFAYLGYLGSGGNENESIVRACASLELVHVCALIHDDVMDGSDTRRNSPAIHRYFESLHRDSSYHGNSEKFGVAAAILLGDLALVWADRLLIESGITDQQLISSMPLFTEMREELMAGQYLDVLEGALATSNVERSLKIARYKSGKYSIERPLHFGAALAGAPLQLSLRTLNTDCRSAKHSNFEMTFLECSVIQQSLESQQEMTCGKVSEPY